MLAPQFMFTSNDHNRRMNQDCPTMFTMLHFPSQMCELATLMTTKKQQTTFIVGNRYQQSTIDSHQQTFAIAAGGWLLVVD